MAVHSVPMIFNLGPTELVIILVILLLLFGGSRLAGLGRSSGRALKEFKEETKGLRGGDSTPPASPPPANGPVAGGPTTWPQPGAQQAPGAPSWEQRSPSEPWPDQPAPQHPAPHQPNGASAQYPNGAPAQYPNGAPAQWPTPPQSDVSSPSYPASDVRRDS